MLALAIISTVILSFFLLVIADSIATGDYKPIGFMMAILLGFVIMSIWFLYAR